MKKLFITLLIIASTICSGCTKKVTAYDAISKSAVELLRNCFEEHKSPEKLIDYRCKKMILTRFLGYEKKTFAICTSIDDKLSLTFAADIRHLKIDDYESTAYYGYGLASILYGIEAIIIYKNGRSYFLDDAYEQKIISLDFIKTFDEFQLEHTPEELKNIYI